MRDVFVGAGLAGAAVVGCVALLMLVHFGSCCLMGWVLQAVWNTVLVSSFGLQPIGYWLSVGIVCLSTWFLRLVFGPKTVTVERRSQ